MTFIRFFLRRAARVCALMAVSMAALTGTVAHAAPAVVVSINPLHGLVADLMDSVASPVLLMPGGSSPHGWAMRPSQARAIQQADLVVWVGPPLEQSLSRALAAADNTGRQISLITLDGLSLLERRSEHDHDAHDGHHHDIHEPDPHLWLDPGNASRIAAALADRLARIDPPSAPVYQANAEKLQTSLRELAGEIRAALADVRGQQLVVYHDAFQYFERFAGLGGSLVITAEPDQPRSLAQMSRLGAKLDGQKLRCLFTEPQFDGRMVRVIGERYGLSTFEIDPMGRQTGKGSYQAMMRALVDSIRQCTAAAG